MVGLIVDLIVDLIAELPPPAPPTDSRYASSSASRAALPWMTPALLADLCRPIDAPSDPAALMHPGAPQALDPRFRVNVQRPQGA